MVSRFWATGTWSVQYNNCMQNNSWLTNLVDIFDAGVVEVGLGRGGMLLLVRLGMVLGVLHWLLSIPGRA